jgi:hypothetical protein
VCFSCSELWSGAHPRIWVRVGNPRASCNSSAVLPCRYHIAQGAASSCSASDAAALAIKSAGGACARSLFGAGCFGSRVVRLSPRARGRHSSRMRQPRSRGYPISREGGNGRKVGEVVVAPSEAGPLLYCTVRIIARPRRRENALRGNV